MRPLGFRARLSLWHTIVAASILGLAGFAGHWMMTKTVLGQLDAALVTLAEREVANLQSGSPIRIHEVAPGTAPPSFARLDRFVQIVALDGHVVARSVNLGTSRLPISEPMLARLRADEVVRETFHDFGEEPIRLVAVPFALGEVRYAVQVAGSLDDAHAVVNAGRWLFVGLSATLLAALALTSALFARRALRPIDEIVARARQIGQSNLAARLPHPGTQDEIGRLVDTLNAMLARIAHGVESQRRFTADASHELRSPLSRLRAELEVTLRRPREGAEYEEALRSCLDEVERLSELTEELLLLARLDADQDPARPVAPTLLRPLMNDAFRRMSTHAHRRGVRLVLDGPSSALAVKASPVAVSLALTNVLENAIKFSPEGAEVHLTLAAEGEEAVLAVSDSGPGVPEEEIPHIFERFHRGDAASGSEAHGFGLGLAISRAAVEGQGGRILAEAKPEGGAVFRIRLPLAG